MKFWGYSLVLLFGLLLTLPLRAGTALQDLAIAEKVVSPTVHGKLVWIRATEEKGVAPPSWSYLFFDTYAKQNGRLIVVTGGVVTKIDEGLVELDHGRLAAYKDSEVMGRAELKLDSSAALNLVRTTSGIDKIPLSTVHYILQLDDNTQVPTWDLTLYALREGDEVEFGHARVSAVTGQIFTMDVELNKLGNK